MLSPSLSTLQSAISRNFISDSPGLAAAALRQYSNDQRAFSARLKQIASTLIL
jgi:hypothetical protein